MIGSQTAYARHVGISKQAVNKMVKQGKIPLTANGKIDFAVADHARQNNGDPARLVAMAPPIPPPEYNVDDLPPEKAAQSGLSFSEARAEREAYQAKRVKLEYERQIGLLLPKREIEDAMVASGLKIRLGLDGIIDWADALDATARNGGAVAVRAFLKEKVRNLESMVAESLNLLADDET